MKQSDLKNDLNNPTIRRTVSHVFFQSRDTFIEVNVRLQQSWVRRIRNRTFKAIYD